MVLVCGSEESGISPGLKNHRRICAYSMKGKTFFKCVCCNWYNFIKIAFSYFKQQHYYDFIDTTSDFDSNMFIIMTFSPSTPELVNSFFDNQLKT